MKSDAAQITSYYLTYLQDLHNALNQMIVTDRDARKLTQEHGLLEWCRMCHEAKLAGHIPCILCATAPVTPWPLIWRRTSIPPLPDFSYFNRHLFFWGDRPGS